MDTIKVAQQDTSSSELRKLKEFCKERIGHNLLHVLYDDMPEVLYGVDGPIEDWRSMLDRCCCSVLGRCLWHYGQEIKDINQIVALTIWPEAIPYMPWLDRLEIRKVPIDIRGVGNTDDGRTIVVRKFPDEDDRSFLQALTLRQSQQYWIMEPALAPESYTPYVIDLLKTQFGTREEQIIVLAVSATRAGVYCLYKRYPNVRVLAYSLFADLGQGIWVDKFGGVGPKYLYQNSVESFKEVRSKLSLRQWEYLLSLIEEANAIKV